MSDDYEVGYGKPPLEHRFKPGQSGNPKGRAKGSRNVATIIRKALNQKILVADGGRRRRVSKLEAACIQQSNKAAGGDRHVMKILTDTLVAAKAVEAAKSQGRDVDPETLRQHYATVLGVMAEREAHNSNIGEEEFDDVE